MPKKKHIPLKKLALNAAQDQAQAALKEAWEDIWTAKEQAAVEHGEADKKSTFRYGTAIALTIEPKGEKHEIGCKISWAQRHSVELIGKTVTDQPELFDGKDEE